MLCQHKRFFPLFALLPIWGSTRRQSPAARCINKSDRRSVDHLCALIRASEGCDEKKSYFIRSSRPTETQTLIYSAWTQRQHTIQHNSTAFISSRNYISTSSTYPCVIQNPYGRLSSAEHKERSCLSTTKVRTKEVHTDMKSWPKQNCTCQVTQRDYISNDSITVTLNIELSILSFKQKHTSLSSASIFNEAQCWEDASGLCQHRHACSVRAWGDREPGNASVSDPSQVCQHWGALDKNEFLLRLWH